MVQKKTPSKWTEFDLSHYLAHSFHSTICVLCALMRTAHSLAGKQCKMYNCTTERIAKFSPVISIVHISAGISPELCKAESRQFWTVVDGVDDANS